MSFSVLGDDAGSLCLQPGSVRKQVAETAAAFPKVLAQPLVVLDEVNVKNAEGVDQPVSRPFTPLQR